MELVRSALKLTDFLFPLLDPLAEPAGERHLM
jgi:hypothetical protein